MLSMTGYGRGDVTEGKITLCVEIKTVNNRYLDVGVKGSRIFLSAEDLIRKHIRDKIARGHVDVFLTLSDKRDKQKSLYLDEGMAQAYVSASRRLHYLHPDLENDFTISSLMRSPDILCQEEAQSADDEIISALLKALDMAIENLNAMREIEGGKLKNDILSRMDTIAELVNRIKSRAPQVCVEYTEKVREKIAALLGDADMDESRILTEAALFADKCNIDEELTRLSSHISQFREICKGDGVGKKLDFLVQEFNRESNTICSKSNDIVITQNALSLKNEIEKIREQVQNIE